MAFTTRRATGNRGVSPSIYRGAWRRPGRPFRRWTSRWRSLQLADLAAAATVVLVAAVRYGRHLPEADRFLTVYRSLQSPPPLALASVNLTARKPGKTTATGNAYLRKVIARHRLAPAVAVAFAGRLDYRRYGWRDRWIIRFIMLLTGGPTDPTTCIEYTSWRRGRRLRGRRRRAGAAHRIAVTLR